MYDSRYKVAYDSLLCKIAEIFRYIRVVLTEIAGMSMWTLI
jgi:hypothetical protein